RPFRAGVAPEREDNAAFVLAQDAHGRVQDGNNENRDDGGDCGRKHDLSSLLQELDRQAGTTRRTRPSRSTTLTRLPGLSGAAARARQISPLTRTRPSSPCQETVSPSAPSSASLPVTIACLRDRSSMESTSRNRPAVAMPAPAITAGEISNPGTS